MKTISRVIAVLTCFLLLPAGSILAADQTTVRERIQTQEQEHIYGSQMMTEQERHEYRSRMQAAKTDEERELIRMELHERMTKRAKAQGLILPDSPPAEGSLKRPGGGMGGGKGKKY